MKNYESRFINYLQKRTYTIIRLSIEDFRNYSKNFNKPFDYDITSSLRVAIKGLCHKVQGLKFAYSYGNEIILLFTDFDNPGTRQWLNGNRDSILSITTSIVSDGFNKSMYESQIKNLMKDPVVSVETFIKYLDFAYFKGACFQIADRNDVIDYIVGAQESCILNCMKKYSEELDGFSNGMTANNMSRLLERNEVYVEEMPAYEKWGSMMHTTEEFRMSECRDAINFRSDIESLNNWIP